MHTEGAGLCIWGDRETNSPTPRSLPCIACLVCVCLVRRLARGSWRSSLRRFLGKILRETFHLKCGALVPTKSMQQPWSPPYSRARTSLPVSGTSGCSWRASLPWYRVLGQSCVLLSRCAVTAKDQVNQKEPKPHQSRLWRSSSTERPVGTKGFSGTITGKKLTGTTSACSSERMPAISCNF